MVAHMNMIAPMKENNLLCLVKGHFFGRKTYENNNKKNYPKLVGWECSDCGLTIRCANDFCNNCENKAICIASRVSHDD